MLLFQMLTIIALTIANCFGGLYWYKRFKKDNGKLNISLDGLKWYQITTRVLFVLVTCIGMFISMIVFFAKDTQRIEKPSKMKQVYDKNGEPVCSYEIID